MKPVKCLVLSDSHGNLRDMRVNSENNVLVSFTELQNAERR